MKKIIIIEVAVITSIIILLTIIIIILNVVIYNNLIKIKKDIISDVKEKTGFLINYENILPNFIGKIKVTKVSLYDNEGTKLDIGDINLYYSIFNLIFSKDLNFFNIFHKLKIYTINLKINKDEDFTKLKKILNKFKNNNKRSVIVNNFKVEIDSATIFIINKDKRYSIKSEKINLKYNNKNIKVDCILSILIKKYDQVLFSSRILIDGINKKEDNITTSNFNFNIIKTNIGKTNLKPLKFVYKGENNNFSFYKGKDNLPLILNISKIDDKIFIHTDINNFNTYNLIANDKKDIYIPDKITLITNLIINSKTKENEGNLTFAINYDKLLFLKNFGIDFKSKIRNEYIDIEKFIIYNETRENNISFQGSYPFYDKDFKIYININNFLLPKTRINSKININKVNKSINISGDYFYLNSINLGHFNFIYEKKDKITLLKTIKSFNGYEIDGKISNENSSNNIIHNFSKFNISQIIRAYNPDYKNTLYLDGKLITETSKKRGFNVKKSNFSLIIDNKAITKFNFKYANSVVTLNNVDLFNKNIHANGILNLKKKPALMILNIASKNSFYKILSKYDGNSLMIKVNDKFVFNYIKNESKIYIKSDNFDLPINNKIATINTNLIIDLNNKFIDKSTVSISNIKLFQNDIGDLFFNISYKKNNLIINNFSYTDKYSYITGQLIQKLNLKDFIITGNGFFKDDKKNESYSINYDINKTDIKSKIYITNIDLNKFINNLYGNINARVNISGNIKNPDIDFEMDIMNGKLNKTNLSSFIISKKQANEINIKKFYLQIGTNTLILNDSQLKFKNDKLELFLKGNIYAEFLNKIIKSNMVVFGNYNIHDKSSNLIAELNNMTIGYIKSDSLFNIEKIEPIQISIINDGNSLNIKDIKSKLFNLLFMKNLWQINIYNKKNIAFVGKIDFSENKLNGSLSFNKFPVNYVNRIILPYVNIAEGLIDGTIDLKGKKNYPEYYGKLNVYYGKVILDNYLKEPITNITGIIIADKDKFLVRNVNGSEGDGLAHGYGEIVFNGWKFDHYYFQINSNTIPCAIKIGPVEGTGKGFIKNLIIEARQGIFNFIGDLFIESADINLSTFNTKEKRTTPKKYPINVFMNFESGGNVKVNYPIIKGILNENENLLLKYIGEEPNIYLGGKLSFKKGEVNYINKKFKIENALFEFDENDYRVNPNVNLKAFYKTNDSRREPVTIYLLLNKKLFPFDTSFYSYPHKTQDEINGILGLTYLADKSIDNQSDTVNTNNAYKNINTLTETTDYLANAIVLTPFENQIRKFTGLDTFTMETKMFGNILKSNIDQATTSANILDLLDESSVTIGKYLFDELYFESMMTFNKRNDINNQFFLPLRNADYGFNLQFMLQLELQYVQIGYSFLPKDYKNLLNSEHRISFEFDYKF
jgi:hypothetical protein